MHAGETVLTRGGGCDQEMSCGCGRSNGGSTPRSPAWRFCPQAMIVSLACRAPGRFATATPMLASQVARAGGEPQLLGIAPDWKAKTDAPRLEADSCFRVCRQANSIVPGVLQEWEFRPIFTDSDEARKPPCSAEGQTLIFGLPGNPVSSLICFELFVRPALSRLMGDSRAEPRTIPARLRRDHRHKSDRPTYHPATLTFDESGPVVDPSSWFGSADLRGLANSNAFVLFPPADEVFSAGRVCPALVVDDSPFSRQSMTR